MRANEPGNEAVARTGRRIRRVADTSDGKGTLALLGGGEWQEPCRDLDRALLALSGGTEVVVLPAAAAFEHPGRVVERAASWFGALGAEVTALDVVNRRDAEEDRIAKTARGARFLYIADGSPLHLRSVLKGSALYEAMLRAYNNGAVLAASGAGATLLCDPMVDPRGGAYTVGLGLVKGMAVFPYHGRAAEHLKERSVELLPDDAVLVGLDEHTALVRNSAGDWRVDGPGCATLYRDGDAPRVLRVGEHVEVPLRS
jgi:cyanophycinase